MLTVTHIGPKFQLLYSHRQCENDGEDLRSSSLRPELPTFDDEPFECARSAKARRKARTVCRRTGVRKTCPAVFVLSVTVHSLGKSVKGSMRCTTGRLLKNNLLRPAASCKGRRRYIGSRRRVASRLNPRRSRPVRTLAFAYDRVLAIPYDEEHTGILVPSTGGSKARGHKRQ